MKCISRTSAPPPRPEGFVHNGLRSGVGGGTFAVPSLRERFLVYANTWRHRCPRENPPVVGLLRGSLAVKIKDRPARTHGPFPAICAGDPGVSRTSAVVGFRS